MLFNVLRLLSGITQARAALLSLLGTSGSSRGRRLCVHWSAWLGLPQRVSSLFHGQWGWTNSIVTDYISSWLLVVHLVPGRLSLPRWAFLWQLWTSSWVTFAVKLVLSFPRRWWWSTFDLCLGHEACWRPIQGGHWCLAEGVHRYRNVRSCQRRENRGIKFICERRSSLVRHLKAGVIWRRGIHLQTFTRFESIGDCALVRESRAWATLIRRA